MIRGSVGLALLAAGCSVDGVEPTGGVAQAVIYDDDDRREPFELEDTALASAVGDNLFALVAPDALRRAADGVVSLRAATLSAWDDYCGGERFLEQPTAGECAATLIDRDLVLTAAHCLGGELGCRNYFFVRHYAERAPGELYDLASADVYSCRALAAFVHSAPDESEQLDFAVVQLDRSVEDSAPFEVGSSVEPEGSLTVAGFPLGLPLKLDAGAVVLDPGTAANDSFKLAADTYSKSSGSAVLDQSSNLLGVLLRGQRDFEDNGDCRKSRVVSGSVDYGETAGYAYRAVEALCAAGWPSEPLCGVEPRCGDGVCSSPEDASGCPEDCALPECGDLLCEQSEWESCLADCGDRRAPGVPDAWYCPGVWYGDGETCDCGCGSLDVDCASADASACDSVGPGQRPPPPVLSAAGGCSSAPRGAHHWFSVFVGVALWLTLGSRRRSA